MAKCVMEEMESRGILRDGLMTFNLHLGEDSRPAALQACQRAHYPPLVKVSTGWTLAGVPFWGLMRCDVL